MTDELDSDRIRVGVKHNIESLGNLILDGLLPLALKQISNK